MGRKTQFLNLHLADANDVYDVEVDQNQNFEKIDKKLKELDSGKEPIINKKSGFNLDKTDEYNLDDTNKLGTARALKKLYDFLKNKIESIKLNWEGISDKPAFGLGRGEFLEGHRLAESLGVEEYGGLINQSGRKEKGKAYYDTNTKEMFLCIKSTTATSASAEDFKPFSNKALLERLENLYNNTVERGYYKIGMLIIQWGYVKPGIHAFPIAFPNECLSIASSGSGSGNNETTSLYIIDKNKFKALQQQGKFQRYIAVGY